jgi:hypothetical protein
MKDLNMNLMQILEIIEKKLDKESESNQSKSHKFPDEERRSRRNNEQHHHSQKHSHRRENNRSSPSLVRKHSRYGVDKLKGEMNKIKPPTFDGENQMDEESKT